MGQTGYMQSVPLGADCKLVPFSVFSSALSRAILNIPHHEASITSPGRLIQSLIHLAVGESFLMSNPIFPLSFIASHLVSCPRFPDDCAFLNANVKKPNKLWLQALVIGPSTTQPFNMKTTVLRCMS